MMCNRLVVITQHDGGGLFCLGIVDDYDKALGIAMNNIFDFKRSYEDEGDIFSFSSPYDLDGDGGQAIPVTYKHSGWDKEYTDYYYILYA